MAEELADRRGSGIEIRRNRRLIVGLGSSVPVAVLVAFVYQEYFGKQMDNTVAIAIASLIGSLGTGISICFHDMHHFLCAYLIRRRLIRPRRKSDQ